MARSFVCCPHCGAPAALSGEIEWLVPDDYFDGEDDAETYTDVDDDIETTIDGEYENETEVLRTELPYQQVGEHLERIDDRSVRETHVAGQRTQGLVVETIRNEVPAPKPKPQTRQAMTQQLPNFRPVRPPKKQRLSAADAARPGFEVYGDDPTQDFVGLSGQEAHMDALLQQAWESDVESRGFNPNII
jgi:hypothetical protein